jgi:hypothetical protein
MSRIKLSESQKVTVQAFNGRFGLVRWGGLRSPGGEYWGGAQAKSFSKTYVVLFADDDELSLGRVDSDGLDAMILDMDGNVVHAVSG